MKLQKMMVRLLTLLLLLGLAACTAQPAAVTQAPATATTASASVETLEPLATNTVEVATETATAAPTATSTPAPTATPEPTATLEAAAGEFGVVTEAPVNSGSSIYITLPKNTICRLGPATVYQSVASIPAGSRVNAVGRLANDEIYYYIVNPTAPDTHCWVFGQGALVEGNRAELDIIAPLASPTPDMHANFTVTYSNIKVCNGDDYSFSFLVENTDDTVWQSIKVYIVDTKTKTAITYARNQFEESHECHLDNVQGDLSKGERAFITPFDPGHFEYRPYGGKFLLRVTLCTQKDFAGYCLTKEITVRP